METSNIKVKHTYNVLRDLYKLGKPVGNSLNRKLMRDFRIYMAVGRMPQAVEVYVEGRNFTEIDEIKREIIIAKGPWQY